MATDWFFMLWGAPASSSSDHASVSPVPSGPADGSEPTNATVQPLDGAGEWANDSAPRASWAEPDAARTGNAATVGARATAASPSSLATTAGLTNPISDPPTPTASDWPGWLNWTGAMPSSVYGLNRTINVGVYRGGEATWKYPGAGAVKVYSVSDQFFNNIKEIFAEMSKFINLTFNILEITSISSTGSSHPIRIFDAQTSSYAYAYNPGTGAVNSDAFFNRSYDQSGSDRNYFQNGPGSHGWSAVWHEIGHALGLDHTFNSGTPAQYDNWNYSDMTYTFTGGEPTTWMAGDVALLQYYYGANPSTNSDNTNYVFSDIDAFTPSYAGLKSPLGSSPSYANPFSTTTNALLYDAAGSDTCDFSFLTKAIRYDFDNITGTSSACYLDEFRQTTYTTNNIIHSMTASLSTVAYGTQIEKVIGTIQGDQYLTVASRSETIDGLSGGDIVQLNGSATSYSITSNATSPIDSQSEYTAITTGVVTDYFKNITYFAFTNETSLYTILNGQFALA